MSRVLVTGAAGFIGSHLVDRLLEMGHKVTGVDCFTDYYPESTKRRNLSKAIPHKRFRFVEGDLLHLDLEELTGQVDRVVHLAGEPEVRSSWRERFSTYLERNARTTQLLLEAVAATETEHFVLASLSWVYGSYNGRPVDEDAPKRPASPYGMSKLAAEELVGLYGCERGVPATVVRYFPVYGPRQRPEMAFSRFISLALSGEPVEVFGDGTQTREMTYVSDVADATATALKARPAIEPRAYNVGGGARTTVNNIVELVEEAIGERVEVRFGPPVTGDVSSTCADLGRAARELGYEPKVSLEEGVEMQVRRALARRPKPSMV